MTGVMEPPGRAEKKDTKSSKRASMRRSDQGGRSSRSGNPTIWGGPGTSRSGGNSITDSFSSEVFRIVMHNPTTAHRFQRFFQEQSLWGFCRFLAEGV